MNQAIKLGRLAISETSSIFSVSSSSSSNSCRKGGAAVSSVRCVQQIRSNSTGSAAKFDNRFDNMDKATTTNTPPPQNTPNMMAEAFGEGYATRSDEEGFGGIYGRNDEQNVEGKVIQKPEDHDSSQGSEVKEKEKARHQTHIG